MIPIAYALTECQRTQNVGEIPCAIISSWSPGTCSDYSLTIYNSSGDVIQDLAWSDYTPVCNATFNITDIGSYHYNSTIEQGVITVEGDAKMITAMIILIPLIMALVLMIGSFALGEKHSVLSIFLFLGSLLMFFVSFHAGMLGVVKFMNYPELQEFIGSTTYWYAILFGGVMLYFIIYMFYTFIKSAAQAKQERIEF